VSPHTTIAVRQGDPVAPDSVQASLFEVSGNLSGPHPGSVLLADDGKTVIFKPDAPFAPGETVAVTLLQGLRTQSGDVVEGRVFDFAVSPRAPQATDLQVSMAYELPPEALAALANPAQSAGVAVPAAWPSGMPVVTVTAQADGTGDGYTFLCLWKLVGGYNAFDSYLLILDDAGEPVFHRLISGFALDFKRQPNGLLSYYLNGTYYVMDSSYNIVDRWSAGHGYYADNHDLQLLPNGNALLIIYDEQPVDMSKIVAGGWPTATAYGLIVQELDPAKNVVFEWRSWDHFKFTDSWINLIGTRLDFIHGNAVEPDHDGNLMISSRNLSEITKINRQTGAVMWRLGGKMNQFTLYNDTEFFDTQHDIRRLPNGNISLFDNRANLRPAYSRAVEYDLDEVNLTATRVWQYRNTPDINAWAMGNAQRLPNGNTVIGWGSAGRATEVKPDGSIALELLFGGGAMSYRAFRFPWHGHPMQVPRLTVTCPDATTTLLKVSWNGATDVTAYRVYAGPRTHPTTLVATAPKAGYETEIVVRDMPNAHTYFRVMPLDNLGWEMVYSNEVYAMKMYMPIAAK